jgi:histidine triad (HIT) family protein
MKDSIFTKIIKGEILCYKVYEDNKTLAFLDIHPIQPGQTLVVPKTQVEYVWDLSDEDYSALMSTAKKVANRLRQVFPEKSRIAMHIEGLDVAHAHLKIFPFDNDVEFRNRPNMEVEAGHQQLSVIASKLAF